MMQMLGNLGAKRNVMFSAPQTLLKKKRSHATDGTNSRCSALLRICASFSYFLCERRVYRRYTTSGCERKVKNFMLLSSVPPAYLIFR